VQKSRERRGSIYSELELMRREDPSDVTCDILEIFRDMVHDALMP
jgi:hypothetical protein